MTNKNAKLTNEKANMIQERLNILRLATDDEILNNTEKIIQEERRLTADLLQHLREIDRRMIFAKMGYASLYEFLVHRFGYSSGAAYRRIATMRLIRELPEVENKVTSGLLNLTSAAKAQSFFREIKIEKSIQLTVEEKTEVLKQLENKSTREVDKILLQLSPNSIPKDRARQITDELTEIKFIASEDLKKKLDFLKELISNKIPMAGYRDVISEASDMAIDHIHKCKKKINVELNLRHATTALDQHRVKTQASAKSRYIKRNVGKIENNSLNGSHETRREYISTQLRAEVWRKGEAKCSFRAAGDAQACGSRYKLEIDHIIPVAKGGRTELANLRLLCQTHNLYEAKRIFGEEHMAKHVNKFL